MENRRIERVERGYVVLFSNLFDYSLSRGVLRCPSVLEQPVLEAPLSRGIILEHRRTPVRRSFIPFPQNCPNLGNRPLFSLFFPPFPFFSAQQRTFCMGMELERIERRFPRWLFSRAPRLYPYELTEIIFDAWTSLSTRRLSQSFQIST